MRVIIVLIPLLVACSVTSGEPVIDTSALNISEDISAGLADPLPAAAASGGFWNHWKDGKAELTGYAITTPRYGESRQGHLVLVTVAQEMDHRTWLKDEAGTLPAARKLAVLKQNKMLKFRTGIYPYSVMTSVFAAADVTGRERFAPGKISFSAQEWCGHVYQNIYPKGTHFYSQLHSYFTKEGNRAARVEVAPGGLYEDALLIQLRGLDGPFNGGKDWRGALVPTLWNNRKTHVQARPVQATVQRRDATRNGRSVHRFVLAYGSVTRTIDVDPTFPHHVLGWETSGGEKATMLRSSRIPYWKLNHAGGESYLSAIGLGCVASSSC